MVRFPWRTVGILVSIAVVVGLRLGYKTATLTETDIIDHYVGAFLDEMLAQGQIVDSGHCHATAGQRVFERMIVLCKTQGDDVYSYSVGYWGQLLHGRPTLIAGVQ